jgi:hypothetical protein
MTDRELFERYLRGEIEQKTLRRKFKKRKYFDKYQSMPVITQADVKRMKELIGNPLKNVVRL